MAKPTLLLYDPGNSPWVPKLKQHCAIQGLRLRLVEPTDLGRTVSALAQGLAPVEQPSASATVAEPMLIFCSLTNAQLDRILAALRKAEAPRTLLKAVLTPTNASWTLAALYGELCRERESMMMGDFAHLPMG